MGGANKACAGVARVPALRRANDGRTLRLSKLVRPLSEPPAFEKRCVE